MKRVEADVAIIGAGTAGMAAYRAALAHTQKVVLIEGGELGTTCARVGCMPSKLLIAAADAAHEAARAPLLGIHIGDVTVDGAAVMRRVREERDRFVGFVTEAVAQWPAHHVLRGMARFVDTHTLDVGGHLRVQAQCVVIATGSRPAVPKAWREQLGDRLLVNDDLFDWKTLPASVAVVGAGIVGLELAQALHRLGVRICVYGRDSRVGPLSDPRLQALARECYAQTVPLALDSGEITVKRANRGVVVRAHDRDVASFDFLLAAIGRTPNVGELNLAVANLPLDEYGVPVFDRHTCRVGDSHVFIAGDADDDQPLLHEAADEGRIAGDNAGRYPDVRAFSRRVPMSVVFTDPQMMMVGASHARLTDLCTNFAVGEVLFNDQGRSRIVARNQGALRLYGEPGTGRLLGAEMLGPAAEHLAHLLAWSIERSDTVERMLAYPFYHPVIEEGLRSALRALRRNLRMGPQPVARCLDCGPGA